METNRRANIGLMLPVISAVFAVFLSLAAIAEPPADSRVRSCRSCGKKRRRGSSNPTARLSETSKRIGQSPARSRTRRRSIKSDLRHGGRSTRGRRSSTRKDIATPAVAATDACGSSFGRLCRTLPVQAAVFGSRSVSRRAQAAYSSTTHRPLSFSRTCVIDTKMTNSGGPAMTTFTTLNSTRSMIPVSRRPVSSQFRRNMFRA